MHERNIIHRDIKMENFLVDSDEHDTINVKLTDFGLACHFDPNKPPTAKCGSLLSVAPEMLIQDYYDLKVDIWGLGIVLHELLCDKVPFYEDDDAAH